MQAIAERPATAEAMPTGPGEVVFAEMMLLYGAKFAQQWTGLTPREIKAAWNQKLQGFTPEEIRRGLDACMGHDWPPTLPEFIRMCRPAVSAEAAYHEAVAGMAARARGERGEWSHPAIYWAAVRVTSHDLLSVGWQAIRGRWEAALRDVMAKGRWDAVPDPVQALPAPGQTHLTPQEKARFLGALKQLTGSASITADGRGGDQKAWARRILENPEDKTVAVLEMARRALDVEVAE